MTMHTFTFLICAFKEYVWFVYFRMDTKLANCLSCKQVSVELELKLAKS